MRKEASEKVRRFGRETERRRFRKEQREREREKKKEEEKEEKGRREMSRIDAPLGSQSGIERRWKVPQ